MKSFNLPISNNPLKTREDLAEALKQIIAPLEKRFSNGGAFLHLGNTSAHYPEASAEMEGFSRLLWGLAPFWVHEDEQTFLNIYRKGLINGTDPESGEYWGDVYDFDQKIVEMAALSLTLCLVPDKIWAPLTDREKGNVYNWLNQVNDHKLPMCNWIFFRVFVNSAFKLLGLDHNETVLQGDFELLEGFYIADGWYFDKPDQIDYYIPFAMHFYGLIYSRLMKDADPPRCEVYRKRAAVFAKDFAYWFGSDGEAVPFGRSLTYRFSQCAFFSALAYAGVEADGLTLGEIKGIILKHFRSWFAKPIFDVNGVLTIGYNYPNLFMSEKYNAPGSPYWSLKSFLILALDKDSDFWQAQEEELRLDSYKFLKHPRMIMTRDKAGTHVLAYTAGQTAEEHGRSTEKYEKLVYSNKFGFSVARGNTLDAGGFDNTLAISAKGEDFYRIKRRSERYEITNDYLYQKNRYFAGVDVETYVIPSMPWHVRIHIINCETDINTADGGFAIARESHMQNHSLADILTEGSSVFCNFKWGLSGIVDETGNGEVVNVKSFPNTNLMAPSTFIPTVTHSLTAGRHVLISSVVGSISDDKTAGLSGRPEVQLSGETVSVNIGGKEVIINI